MWLAHSLRDGWSLAFSPLQASGSQVENDYAPRVTVSQQEETGLSELGVSGY